MNLEQTSIGHLFPRFKSFKPSGPVSAAYMADVQHSVQVIRGPVGSGKTVTSIYKILDIASRLMPVCLDGAIHCRCAVIGVTYGQLEKNLYETWHMWLPKDGRTGDGQPSWFDGEWEGGRGRYATQRIEFDTLRRVGGVLKRVPVKLQFLFSAIGEQSVDLFVKGFEPSMWYIYEVDQFPDGIIEQCLGRLGRYPASVMLPEKARWAGLVIGDTNTPDIDHWYHDAFEENLPATWKQYVQPPGDSAEAENLHNLRDPDYYEKKKIDNARKPKWIRRMIKCQYGPSGDGDPVYDNTFSRQRHVAQTELRGVPGRPIYIGMDQGLRPAAVIYQPSSMGQRRVLGEVANDRMSPRRFVDALADELAIVAPGCSIASMWADPAGFTGVDDQDSGDMAWADQVWGALVAKGMVDDPILPADSNTPDICIVALEDELAYMVSADEPALLVSPRCKKLIRALTSEYKYEKRAETKDQVRRPIKNHPYADLVNALQYGLVGEKGRHGVIAGPRDRAGGRRGEGSAPVADTASSVIKAPVDLA